MVVDLELAISALRSESFFPSPPKFRPRIDEAFFAVLKDASRMGASVRKFYDLVKAHGADTEISKPGVSRICPDLEADVAAFAGRQRSDTAFRAVSLTRHFDGPHRRGGKGSRVALRPVVEATGFSADARREVLRFAVGDSAYGSVPDRGPPLVEGPQPVRRPVSDLP